MADDKEMETRERYAQVMAKYEAKEAQLLLADFADRSGLKESAAPVGSLDEFIAAFAVVTAKSGIKIDAVNQPEVPSVRFIFEITGQSSTGGRIEVSKRGILVATNGDPPTRVDVFWNPHGGRFESREFDKDDRRTDPTTILARALLGKLEEESDAPT